MNALRCYLPYAFGLFGLALGILMCATCGVSPEDTSAEELLSPLPKGPLGHSDLVRPEVSDLMRKNKESRQRVIDGLKALSSQVTHIQLSLDDLVGTERLEDGSSYPPEESR